MIYFTKHARDKFDILRRHGFSLTEAQVTGALEHPDNIDASRWPLLIAQSKLDQDHVLRIVYKRQEGVIKIITFYPGRSSQYEKKK